MSKHHGRRHRQRGKKKKPFDVAPTAVTPVTPPAGAASSVSAPSNSVDSHGGGDDN
jgi:hypothetical protein